MQFGLEASLIPAGGGPLTAVVAHYSLQPSASLAAARVQQKLATVMSISPSLPCLPKHTAFNTTIRVWHRPFDDVMPATAKLVPSAGSSIKLAPSSSHATLSMHASSWTSCRVPHATSPGAIGDSRQRPTAHWSRGVWQDGQAKSPSPQISACKWAEPAADASTQARAIVETLVTTPHRSRPVTRPAGGPMHIDPAKVSLLQEMTGAVPSKCEDVLRLHNGNTDLSVLWLLSETPAAEHRTTPKAPCQVARPSRRPSSAPVISSTQRPKDYAVLANNSAFHMVSFLKRKVAESRAEARENGDEGGGRADGGAHADAVRKTLSKTELNHIIETINSKIRRGAATSAEIDEARLGRAELERRSTTNQTIAAQVEVSELMKRGEALMEALRDGTAVRIRGYVAGGDKEELDAVIKRKKELDTITTEHSDTVSRRPGSAALSAASSSAPSSRPSSTALGAARRAPSRALPPNRRRSRAELSR